MEYIFGASGEDATAGKKLQVRVGPSIESLKITSVNDEQNPHFIDSPYFTGNVLVRIKNFKGVTPDNSEPKNCPHYFENKKRLFSLQVAGRFKHEYSADDIVFGSRFEKKVNPPTGAWVAMKFANLIDPALLIDLYAEKPWLFSPILCSMNVVNVQKASQAVVNAAPFASTDSIDKQSIKSGKSVKSTDSTLLLNGPDPKFKSSVESETSMLLKKVTSTPSPVELLGEWSCEKELQEDNALLHTYKSVEYETNNISERRKHFQKQKVRQRTVFSPSYIYNFEIFAPFINLNTFDLSLGININLIPYMNGQPMRLMAKTQSTNVILFVIEFALVDAAENDSEDRLTPDGSCPSIEHL